MKQRLVLLVVVTCLLAAAPTGAAQATVSRKWGQVLDSYGARVYACRLPVHTRAGLQWRYSVRAANRSDVPVEVSVRVRRWVVSQDRTFTRQTWARSLGAGGTTAVGTLSAFDTAVGNTRFFDGLWFLVRRPGDGQVLQWQGMSPTGPPRCGLPPRSIAWRGSGYVSSTGGRMQVCSNMLLDSVGPGVFWRFRGDSTHTTRTLSYNAKRIRVEDWSTQESWSRTIPPGRYTEPGSMRQSVTDVNSHPEEYFDIGVFEGSTDTNAGIAPQSVC